MKPLRVLLCCSGALLLGTALAMQSCVSFSPRPSAALSDSVQNRLKLQDAKDQVLGADIKISMVGDIMLGGTATEIYQKNGYNHAFEETRQLLRRSSLVFGNLEGPLATWGLTDGEKTYSFKSQPDESAAALKYAGFDIVSLANNHALDYGVAGLVQTMQALDKVDINHVGAGLDLGQARTVKFERVGNRNIAFLAYSLTYPETFWATDKYAGVAFGDKAKIIEDIRIARKSADIVMVSMHWGRESTTELRPYQTEIGRAAIDAGASVVIGHHPHILQAIEPYKHGVILYSLGNFAFGSYSQKVDTSVIAQAYFKGEKLAQLRLWPIKVRNTEVLFQSRILDGAAADAVVQHLQDLSLNHGADIVNDNGTGVIFFSG
ncbi:MAG: CapA family protein [Gammaproteobacteria bacterium]|nr:CapA family protein [Gammaproteobacteria bacterium]